MKPNHCAIVTEMKAQMHMVKPQVKLHLMEYVRYGKQMKRRCAKSRSVHVKLAFLHFLNKGPLLHALSLAKVCLFYETDLLTNVTSCDACYEVCIRLF